MLPEGFRLFQDSDVELGAVDLGEFSELDRARESGWPRADDQHVELHTIAGALSALLENQFVEW